jgi:hypothetical protein
LATRYAQVGLGIRSWSVLTGIAANTSIDRGMPVQVAELAGGLL